MELKNYQQTAVESAVDILEAARTRLDDAGDNAQRRLISSHDACLLLEAPTGAGKTLIAGTVAEEMTMRDRIVWFWFAPFSGLVQQSEASIRDHFPRLRVRDLKLDRQIQNIHSGDVFVATWAAVAAQDSKAKKVRQNSETAQGLDNLLPTLREAGFRIGVVVDEAHHSFSAEQTATFYRDVLQPDYTLLVTATPGDTDADRFRRRVGISRLQRLSISRYDAVKAGLIKHGIKCAAYLADSYLQPLVDFESVALRDGWEIHKTVKVELAESGISLTPLLLVQVDSSTGSEARAREKLIKIGIKDDAIATHTAKEPDPNLLSLALDESKEVLIFKMAVALGFDAPRAFTLVSMRGSKDPDFGIQIVGRILRVHRRLQNKEVPETLNWGYVVLADAENQAGLQSAGGRINAIQTDLGKAAPVSLVVWNGEEKRTQIVRNGQPTLDVFWSPASFNTPLISDTDVEVAQPETGQLTMAEIMTGTKAALKKPVEPEAEKVLREFKKTAHQYSLRDGAPRVLRKQSLPVTFDTLVQAISARIDFNDAVLNDARRQKVDLTKDVREIFDQIPPQLQKVRGQLSMQNVEERAEQALLKLEYLSAKDLQSALLERLRREFDVRGQSDMSEDEEALERGLALILVLHPRLLAEAQRLCLREYSFVEDAQPLPETIFSEEPMPSSRFNIYGVMPPDLNRWERNFAEMLDRDTDGVILWWHRNPPLKPHSARVILSNGEGFYPDFIIGVQSRNTPNSIIMIDTKGQINEDKAILEAVAEHPEYGRAMLTYWEEEKKWMTVAYNPTRGRSFVDRVFRPDILPTY